MKKGLTEVVFILDRSGSMSGLEGDTIGGFNSMIEKQKKQEVRVKRQLSKPTLSFRPKSKSARSSLKPKPKLKRSDVRQRVKQKQKPSKRRLWLRKRWAKHLSWICILASCPRSSLTHLLL